MEFLGPGRLALQGLSIPALQHVVFLLQAGALQRLPLPLSRPTLTHKSANLAASLQRQYNLRAACMMRNVAMRDAIAKNAFLRDLMLYGKMGMHSATQE